MKRKTAVVTGASGAIGNAIVSLLKDSGWHVIGIDLKEPGDQGASERIIGDVAEPETWERVRELVHPEDGLDGLVHAAALQLCGPIGKISEADWDRLMDVNVKSMLLASKSLHEALAMAKGAVVGIGSVHSVATSANIAAYAASKGALSALMRALAVEWAPDEIRVNTVLPGAVHSDMLRAGLTRGHLGEAGVETQLEELASRTVIGRVGNPEEIAPVVHMLLNPAVSSFITGTSIVVDGGALARLSTE